MENKNCKNCKYYLAHYVKSDRGFQIVNAGHCVNGEITKRRINACCRLRENCEYWESAELKIRERKEKVKNNLEKLEEYLREVLTVLKDDDSPPRPK